MDLKLIHSLFFVGCVTVSLGQQTNTAYAITGQENANFNWVDIRAIDLASGTAGSTLFESGKTHFTFRDAETGRNVDQLTINGNPLPAATANNAAGVKTIVDNSSPTALMSAANAYDKKHQKLFFAAMRTGQLVWLDLSNSNGTPAFYTLQRSLIGNLDYTDEALNITRMAVGADGNGYALTNDAEHLIRFTTGSKTIITDLGGLIDAASNNGLSVHNKCSSWGGDLVADAFGTMYLLTAGRNVFLIEPQTMTATYKGTISNLPGTYSVNGAAVIDDENVMVSSANTFDGYYKVDINTLAATKMLTAGKVYNASDLASGNLLHQTERQNNTGAASLEATEVLGNRFIAVYPNPVENEEIKIAFDKNLFGKYKITLSDLTGRIIATKEVYIEGPGQVENFAMNRKQAAGIYIIKVIDGTSKEVYSDKIVLQ